MSAKSEAPEQVPTLIFFFALTLFLMLCDFKVGKPYASSHSTLSVRMSWKNSMKVSNSHSLYLFILFFLLLFILDRWHISKKRSPEIQNLWLLRNTASFVLQTNRSIFNQLHEPRLESSALLIYSGSLMNISIRHCPFSLKVTYFRCSDAT